MSERQFGDPPRNGKQSQITYGRPAPTPFQVEIRVNGRLEVTRRFCTKEEAEQFAYGVLPGTRTWPDS